LAATGYDRRKRTKTALQGGLRTRLGEPAGAGGGVNRLHLV
jgi:hypothetical protein